MTTLSARSIQFIEAVRREVLKDTRMEEADHGGIVVPLIIHFQRIFGNDTKDNPNPRKAILSAIFGREIVTQKQISKHAHIVLLREMEDGKSDEILRDIAKALEARAYSEPWGLYPWKDSASAQVPVLSPDYITGQPRLT